MAILKKGILGGIKGKVANVVGYTINGQEVIRAIGENNKPLTNKQLNNKLQMKVIMEFLKSMDTLLETGFNPKAEGTTKNYHNLAIAYNKPHALKGFYPDVEVDYSKVVISAGELPQPINPTVEFVDEGVSWPYSRDQVMLLAYAPESKTHEFKNSGARRIEGSDILVITPEMHKEPLEIYISFVSDDRKRAADSLYLGRKMRL
jgi:hypothetical protein